MNFSKLIIITLCLMIPTLHAAEIASDLEAIELQRQASNAALAARDVEKFVSFFDDDYIITYGSGLKTLSLDAENKSLKKLFEDHADVNYVRSPTDIHLSKALPIAMENGTWVGGQTLETTYRGRYSAAWRKTDDIWKIHSELFVTLECDGKSC
jgi:ketosteroid isomerase-like protein